MPSAFVGVLPSWKVAPCAFSSTSDVGSSVTVTPAGSLLLTLPPIFTSDGAFVLPWSPLPFPLPLSPVPVPLLLPLSDPLPLPFPFAPAAAALAAAFVLPSSRAPRRPRPTTSRLPHSA